MLSREEELRRVLSGEMPRLVGDDLPYGVGVQVSVDVADSAFVLERCREVLSVVLRFGEEDWPSLERWAVELPGWFVGACAPESTPEEAERRMAWWQSLSFEEQRDVYEGPWELSEWLEWLRPSRRTWYWLGASTADRRTLTVSLATPGVPSPTEALEWLLEAAGFLECPVCGGNQLTVKPYESWPPPAGLVMRPPYEDYLGRASYEVCPKCGFEFGNDDNPGTAAPVTFEEYRAEWEAEGSPWFDTRGSRKGRRPWAPPSR